MTVHAVRVTAPDTPTLGADRVATPARPRGWAPLVAVAALVVAVAASATIGSVAVDPAALWQGDHPDHGIAAARIDRTALGAAVGAALALVMMMLLAALAAGFGYGIMQPIIYDKTATIAPPRSATLALSFVMAMNYLAVMICPFILSLLHTLFHTHSEHFGFRFNAVVVLIMALVALFDRKGFVLGLDERYFVA